MRTVASDEPHGNPQAVEYDELVTLVALRRARREAELALDALLEAHRIATEATELAGILGDAA